MKKVAPIFLLLKQAFTSLQANDPVRMAGATAFFSFFALPPIVIILSNVLSLLFNDHYQRVSGQLFDELADLFGPKSANQLEDISHRLQLPKPGIALTILSFVLLFVASTTLFAILKNSLNQLWNVKKKAGGNFLAIVTDKLIALAIILGSGLLFSSFLAFEQLMVQVSNRLSIGSLTYYRGIAGLGHLLVSILIRTVWFAILFKFLPDVRTAWRAVWLGAFFTSCLFKLGEGVLNYLLINSQVGSLYGKAGAIILLLLFVFYASLMFYYGAAFTRQFSEWTHLAAEPNEGAIAYTITEIDPLETKEGE
ncbi:YihY/virulence factor BrkB family protein [Spirosoma pollinicola]|uniref:YihY/virulence factor BrkB family protein n=1 Tax=Spirosoma pollinicola TaxID=2057025 RepID=A0A2K8Z4J7_9BACT|nr:YihY/virulence factor BrkB family protein [Spirosoma pollinicola]AUD04807.1 YihY/virulence factor BrkB family protein [Spirosoma pollinicola]